MPNEAPPTIYVPPTCPHCDEELRVVRETTYDTYVFNPKTGTYKDSGHLTIECGSCGEMLGGDDVPDFGDGMCNYVHSSQLEPKASV